MKPLVEKAERIDVSKLSRSEACRAMERALRARSGKAWSVKGGKGTGYGWLRISAPPRRCGEWGRMTPEDAAELGRLLGRSSPCHEQGESVPSGGDYRQEYADRCCGIEPETVGVPYWD